MPPISGTEGRCERVAKVWPTATLLSVMCWGSVAAQTMEAQMEKCLSIQDQDARLSCIKGIDITSAVEALDHWHAVEHVDSMTDQRQCFVRYGDAEPDTLVVTFLPPAAASIRASLYPGRDLEARIDRKPKIVGTGGVFNAQQVAQIVTDARAGRSIRVRYVVWPAAHYVEREVDLKGFVDAFEYCERYVYGKNPSQPQSGDSGE